MLSKISQLQNFANGEWLKTDNKERNKYYSDIALYTLEILTSLVGLDKTEVLLKTSKKEPDLYYRMYFNQYHLENLYLRCYVFRERLNQLINLVYLGMSEENPTIKFEIENNSKTQIMKGILNELNNDLIVKKVFKARKLLTHQKYDVYSNNKAIVDELCGERWSKNYYLLFYKNFTKFQNKEIKHVIKVFKDIANKVCAKILGELKARRKVEGMIERK